MKQIKIFTYFLISILLSSIDLYARYDDICAFTNESVSKFRDKHVKGSVQEALDYCKTESIIDKSKAQFDWPIDLCEFWISSLFGMRQHRGVSKMHGGVDMAANRGTQVKAAAPGKVLKAEEGAPGYGTVIEILHKGGLITRYGHLEEVYVEEGDKVERGDSIAAVGATGNVRGKNDPSHLHFEILEKNGKRVDPLKYLYCAEVAFAKRD